MKKGWATEYYEDYCHYLPMSERARHELRNCPCKPAITHIGNEFVVYRHNRLEIKAKKPQNRLKETVGDVTAIMSHNDDLAT